VQIATKFGFTVTQAATELIRINKKILKWKNIHTL
jgi:hypothetical protein